MLRSTGLALALLCCAAANSHANIVVDNESSNAVASAGWASATGASAHFGATSLYAVTGAP